MVCRYKEAGKMRNTLEDLYYGNITLGKQQIAPNSELKRTVKKLSIGDGFPSHRNRVAKKIPW